MASAPATKVTSAVAGCPSRTAATMAQQKMTYSSGCCPVSKPAHGPKTSCVSTVAVITATAVSRAMRRDHEVVASVRMTGATTSAPSASPSHHSNQSSGKRSQGCACAAHSTVTPTVALAAVEAMTAPPTNAHVLLRTRNDGLNDGRRPRMVAAKTASIVLPAAMPAAASAGAAVSRFAMNAPSQMAGHMPRPHRSVAATAIPVGAQTVVTCSATKAKWNPSRAVRTYADVTTMMRSRVRM